VKAALALPRKKLTDEFFLFWGAPTDANPTDVGNAERFADMHATQVRYVPQWNSWVVWKNHRWARDALDEVGHRAIITARRIYREASSITDSARREQLGKWAMASESAGRLRAMVEVAATLPEFATSAQEFDARPMLFCTASGVVDLATGEAEPGRPEWLLTRGTSVEFDPRAKCPRWEAFLEETFSGDREMIQYLARCFGYFLTGSTAEQCFFIFYGIGQNGKSTVVEVLHNLLGEYVVKSKMETWVQQARVASGQSEDIARLAGARLVIAEESEEEQRLAVSLIKEATGGDKMTARNMYEKSFEFTPQFKLVIVSNHKPVAPGDDFAFWRRVRLVPFNRIVPDAKKVKDFAKKRLLPELPGILNWALAGLRAYLADSDLGMPAAVKDATAAYKSDSDLLGQFIEEECVVEAPGDGRAPRTAVDTTELYKKYQAWVDERGYRAARTMTWFSRRMQDRGFKKQEGSRRSRLLGLLLRDAAAGNFTEGRASGKVADIKAAAARGAKRGKF
jgi:putative DNA primase/helicase